MRFGWLFGLCAAFVLLVISATIQPAYAQMGLTTTTGSEVTEEVAPVKLPDPLTPEAVRNLVSTLSDEQVRELLLQRLDAVAGASKETEGQEARNTLDYLGSIIAGVGLSTVDAVFKLPHIFDGLKIGAANFSQSRGGSGVLLWLATMAAAVMGGLAVEWIVSRIANKWRRQFREVETPDGLKQTLILLGKRLVLDLGGLIAFLITTRILVLLLVPQDDQQIADVFMLSFVVFPRAVAALSRFLLAPNYPKFRIVHTDDWTAQFMYRHQIGIALLMGLFWFVIEFQRLNGAPLGASRIGYWLNLAVFIWIGFVCYRAREGLSSMLLGGEEDATRAEHWMARAYPWIGIGLVVLTWLLGEILVVQRRFDLLSDGQQYVTMAILLAAPVLDTMVRGLVRHMVPPMRGEGALAEAAYRSTKRSYIRIGRALVAAAVIIIIARIWDIDFQNLASAGVGVRIAGRLFEVFFILAIGYLVWELVSLWLNRKLADEMTAAGVDLEAEEPGGGEGGGVGGSRLSTVLPLLKMAVQVTIITITVLIALGHLGIDITPLIAGAGIVGLAIGFGAQTLVRDVVAGLFFLVDDAFRVGEYLDIDGTVGTVEKISVRSLQLRHHQGPIHTIPYGEIPKVTNNSRDWVIVKLKFTVPFDTDTNKVKKLFKQIGKDIMEAPYAEDIIQTFKSQGVYDVNDVGIVVRGKFMAKPGKQWMIRKDVYSRVQKIFAENDIEFARREVRVNIPGREDGQEGDEQTESAVAAAASQAVIEEQQRLEAEAAAGRKA